MNKNRNNQNINNKDYFYEGAVYKRNAKDRKKRYKGTRAISTSPQSTFKENEELRDSIPKKKKETFCCPYCDTILDKKPKAKEKCPYCNSFIYVRTLPLTGQLKIATEKEKNRIDKDLRAWMEFEALKEWTDLSDKDFINAQEKLKEEFDFDPPFRDVVWRLYHELAWGSKNDPERQSSIYYAMAIYLEKEGKFPFKMLQLSNNAKLKALKKEGHVNKVRISTMGHEPGGACDLCRKNEGKVLTIDHALKTMPIPNPECSYKFKKNHYSFCRCVYNPIVDKTSEFTKKHVSKLDKIKKIVGPNKKFKLNYIL
jgi:hypothetical protein